MNYQERDAVAAVSNIENGLFQLQLFQEKKNLAVPYIEGIIRDLEDEGGKDLDKDDQFNLHFWKVFLIHLKKPARKVSDLCNAERGFHMANAVVW